MDFKDCRSMKVILVSHCVMNQNSRSPTCATCPIAEAEFITGLIERGVGIIQMPCPELMVIGLARGGDDEIRVALDKAPGRAACRKMCEDVVYQIKQYQNCDVQVLGVFGKEGSPSCGVETTYYDGKERPGKGIFIEELSDELEQEGIDLPVVQFQDNKPQANLAIVDDWTNCL